jgi:hypothetical protein
VKSGGIFKIKENKYYMKHKKIILISIISIAFVLTNITIALAADPCPKGSDKLCFIPAITIPGFSTANEKLAIDGSSLAQYIVKIYRYGAMFAGVVAMFMLVYAGWQWLLAGGNSSKISQAREKINGALIGLTLLFGGYILLSLISTNLVRFESLKTALPDMKEICHKILEKEACTANTTCIWKEPADGQVSLYKCMAKSEIPVEDIGIDCSKFLINRINFPCDNYGDNITACNNNVCHNQPTIGGVKMEEICKYYSGASACGSVENRDCTDDSDCQVNNPSGIEYYCKNMLLWQTCARR